MRPELREKLLHLSLLPARLTGYVSTSFGVAVEFVPADATSIHVSHGSARVEDLLVHCPPNLRRIGPMIAIAGRRCGIGKLTLEGAFPFRLSKESADVCIQEAVFKAGTWTQNVEYAEVYGDRSAERWTIDKAIIRAKDELLVALVEDSQANGRGIAIDEYISHFKEQMVLLLGDYDTDGLERLAAISASLRSLGYDPVIVRDVPDHPHQDISAKVIALGAVARFVMVDDSSKSGHLMEIQICKNNGWISVLLRLEGKGGSWISAGASVASSIILEQPYEMPDPSAGVSRGAQWAEEQVKRLEITFSRTYPWRSSAS